MANRSRDKGLRVEREIVKLHTAIGVHAERVPLSGAQRYQENGQDVDIYPFGKDEGPLCCQVKAIGSGHSKVATAARNLIAEIEDADALFLRYDAEPGQRASPPLVVLPWGVYERLLKAIPHPSRAAGSAVGRGKRPVRPFAPGDSGGVA